MLFREPLEKMQLDQIAVAYRRAGEGPPLLLLHGHPQTHAIWHKTWPALAARFTVVAPDLRGYGDSGKPDGGPEHVAYSKRRMALDQVELMQRLGFTSFAVLAHDRGARVAHRLGMDHPQAVTRMTLLDIAPTLAMYQQTTMAFARDYFHWFWLIQPAPFPERMIESDPGFYVRGLMGARRAGLAPFEPEALAEYVRCAGLPGWAAGVCEDYRAAAGIDLVHDSADRAAGRRLPMPLQVLWGAHGVVARCFDVMQTWREVAADVHGQALDCGHYLPEEAPEALLDAALPFLSAR
jgi:haloacetate dehalogenase